MSISDVYVWVWLPQRTDPVVAGVLHRVGDRWDFAYGNSYLARADALPLAPDLPLERRIFMPPAGDELSGVFLDALPDGWGRSVIDYMHGGLEQPLAVYMLESGSDRCGGLDFQKSASEYIPRNEMLSLQELEDYVQKIIDHKQIPASAQLALEHGTSIGGSRPKIITSSHIVKLSISSQLRPLARLEACAMGIAKDMGVDACSCAIRSLNGRETLMLPRFDRMGAYRRHIISLAGFIGFHGGITPPASYVDLVRATGQGEQVFRRIAANMIVGNCDDHARNHAMFWDGAQLMLTPAYDIEVTRSSGWDANLALSYGEHGERAVNLDMLTELSWLYGLPKKTAQEIVAHMLDTAQAVLPAYCARLGLSEQDVRGILHPAVLESFTF